MNRVDATRELLAAGHGDRSIAGHFKITRHAARKLIREAEMAAAPSTAVAAVSGGILARYEAARAALAEAVRVDEVKDVHDAAAALGAYARQAKDRDMEANAVVLRERAERKLGEMLAAQKQTHGLARAGRPKKSVPGEEQISPRDITLADMGIDRKLSSRAQKKAGIAEQAFEAMVEATRERILAGRGNDVLKGESIRIQQTSRRNLQEALSDQSAALPTGRLYPVIYGDPATKFLAGLGNRSTENHYRTMTLDELCALDIASLCLPDCQAFIWSTVPQLANTITRILPAWQFEYSSHCMWDKTSPEFEGELGTGFVFRNQHEVLIYATRGHPPGPAVQPPSIYRERKGKHSRKPEYFRNMIAQMTRGLPTLELFARVDAEHPLPTGWDCWGNEAEHTSAETVAA
jgi:N6-adenosine-specific RNA methylase IME4